MPASKPFQSLAEFQNAIVSKMTEAGWPFAAAVHEPEQVFKPGNATAVLAAKLVIEEAVELAAVLLGESPEPYFLDAIDRLEGKFGGSEEDALKELSDVLYVSYRVAVVYDWNSSAAFNRVHDNNMNKILNGTVRSDGKLQKPANHSKVILKDLI